MLMAVGRGSNGRGQRDGLMVAQCFKFDFCLAVTLMTAGAISVSLRCCPVSLGGTRVAEVVPLNTKGASEERPSFRCHAESSSIGPGAQ